MELRPSLTERNVASGPVVEHPEAPSGISRPTRTKGPSKTLNEEANVERAVHAKHQRAGHLRVRFFKKIQDWILKSERNRKRILRFFTRQINPRSLGSWRVKGTEESTLEMDCLKWIVFCLKSAKRVKSFAFSGNSLKERKRLMEEAQLEMQALKEKQELHRELEEI